jgi:hypothetical protein
MNVTELNPQGHTTLARFFETMFPLTIVTIWIIVAFQSRFIVRDDRGARGVWKKLLWPVMLINTIIPWSSSKDESPAYEYDLPKHKR